MIQQEKSVITKNAPISNLTVSYLNAGSIKNKTFGIRDYIISEDIDIMALTETWLYADEEESSTYINEITPPGYAIKEVARQDGRIGGGVAIIYKKGVHKVVLKCSSKSSRLIVDQFEYMICEVFQTSDPRSRITVVIVYRPSPTSINGLKVSLFWKDWSKFLRQFAGNHTETVFLGDLNFHLDDLNHSSTKKFTNILTQFDLLQHITKPTHTAGHILDVLITKPDSRIVRESVVVHDPGISDKDGNITLNHHFAISFDFPYSKPHPSSKEITYRNLRDIDVEDFEQQIKQLQLAEKLEKCSSVNDMVQIFENGMQNLINQKCPVVTRTVVERPNTSELLAGKQLKRHFERQWQHSGLQSHRILYRNQCALYNKLLNRTYIQHIQTKLSAYEKDPGKLQKYCKAILRLPKPILMIEGCTSDKESADALAEFFKTKVINIANDLDNEMRVSCPTLSPILVEVESKTAPSNVRFSQFEPTSVENIKNLISKSNNKTCDLDVTPTKIIKLFSDSLAPAITIIVNKSLQTGTVPAAYKKGIVIPSLKKPSLETSDKHSFRPVTNLINVSKLLEKVVSKQLITHLNVNHLLPPTQSAYRKNYSTETSLLSLTNKVLSNLDQGRCTLLVTIDISAAFDTVDHKKLLDRYSQYFGLSDTVLLWMESYLSGRSQFIQVGSAISEEQPVDTGFPQGATLAGIKYDMFSTPLHDLADKHQVDHEGYADDSNLFVSFDIRDSAEMVSAIAKLENCLNDVCTWMQINRLKLNRGKTEAILFYPPRFENIVSNSGISVKINGHDLVLQKQIESLGVILDSNMKLEKQVNNVSKVSYFHLRKITRVRNRLNQSITKTLVNTLVTSRLDYCNSLLSSLPKKTTKKLQKVQNASAKAVTLATRRQHVTPILKYLHWLPISYRADFKVLLLTYRILNNMAPESLTSLIIRYEPARSLRSASENFLLRPVIPKNKYGHRAMCNLAPFLWNSLPTAVRKATSVNAFKTMLKTHFFVEHFGSANST